MEEKSGKDGKPTQEEFMKFLKEFWDAAVDFNKPPSSKNFYIDIEESFSENKRGEISRMFFAAIPSDRGVIGMGIGGFLMFVEDMPNTPIKYNGQILPVEEYDQFIKYCKSEVK